MMLAGMAMMLDNLFPLSWWMDPMANVDCAACISLFTNTMRRVTPFYFDDSFNNPDTVLAPMPGHAEFVANISDNNASAMRWAASEKKYPALTREQEQHLFRQLHYLRWMVTKRIEPIKSGRSVERAQRRIDSCQRLFDGIGRVSDTIARCNTRLVAHWCRRFYGDHEYHEYIGQGMMALNNAIRLFDYRRGIKFSTYATWAIVRECNKYHATVSSWNQMRSPTSITDREGVTDALNSLISYEPDYADSDEIAAAKHISEQLLDLCNERERMVVTMRFGLDGNRPMTLKRCGNVLGISKERIRQIERMAMAKMRRGNVDV